MANLRFRLVRAAEAAAVLGTAAAVSLPAAAAAPAPSACTVLSPAIAAGLLKERPRTILSTPLVCQYGRSSERASTTRSTVGLTIVRNATVAAAKATQGRLEKIAPSKAPPGMTGFARAKVSVPGGEATFVYFRQAGGPDRRRLRVPADRGLHRPAHA